MILRKISPKMGLLIWMFGCFLACSPGTPNQEGIVSDGGHDGGTFPESACANACREGSKQCAQEGFQLCQVQSNGCTGWGSATACPDQTTCYAGDCIKSCTNQCSEGAKQCANNGIQLCAQQAGGCTDWSASQPCAAGEMCDGGECVKQCSGQCTPGAKRCNGDGVEVCEKQSDGCADWSQAKACPTGETCSGGRCANGCTDQCATGTRLCSGTGVQSCEKQANGCLDWSKTAPCPTGEVCNGGNCVTNCANQCAEGAVQCSGTGVQTCEKLSSGCFDWGNASPCPATQVCSGGKCVNNCSDQCKENDKRCDGVSVQLCTKQASGCTEWATSKTCASGQACDKSSYTCINTCTNRCNENATKCASTGGVQICEKQTDGCTDWSAATPCPTYQACSNDKCEKTCTDKCTQSSTQCAGQLLQSCALQVDGCLDWSTAQSCPSGETCQGSTCQKGCAHTCVPGQRTCQSGQELECVLVGKCWAWGNAKSCPTTTTCHMGVCAKGAETISKDTELCGVHVYTGTLTIQGGAKVTCSTGELTIYAKQIFIDPSSSIDLSGTSSTPSGGKYNTCGVGTCYTSLGRAGAGGGGNGTVGVTAKGVEYKYRSSQYGSCSCGTCRGGGGGGVLDTVYDQFVSPGGAGGDGCKTVNTYGSSVCYAADVLKGGKGGGVIRLFAEDKITLYGKLLADGADGQPGNAGSGGGAGGGILIAAPELDITGSISANGGAGGVAPTFTASCYTSNRDPSGGAGGKGRIKVLYGDTYKNTGALSGGISSLSWLPPQGLSSSTHPEQALYYNDTFKDFQIAWKKPYLGAKGYWYALDRSATLALTPTNGVYTTATNLALPASSFATGGTWYLYLLTVHSNAVASTMANRWKVQINSKPHQLNSTSHPDQAAWYSGPQKQALNIAWTPPSGVPARSFRGFWYKIDRQSDTAPGRAAEGWSFTTDTQALLTQDAQGNPLDQWVYYFHLVAEDAAGQLTKVAAHYRIQRGAEPAKMNFFGYVKDKSGSAIAGAALRLQPYGITATTDANGYFIFNQIYTGRYQLTAQKTGFKDVDLQVDVNASIVPYQLPMVP